MCNVIKILIPAVVAVFLSVPTVHAKKHHLTDEQYRLLVKVISDSVWSKCPAGFELDSVPAHHVGTDAGAVILGLYREHSLKKNNSVDGKSVALAFATALASGGRVMPVGSFKRYGLSMEHLYRVKVKIIDDRGLDELDKFSFFREMEIKWEHLKQNIINVAGARIYKPDGKVMDITCEDFERLYDFPDGIPTGWLRLPGLEKGDILDFFFYSEQDVTEQANCDMEIPLREIYPVEELTVHCEFDKKLSVNYRGFNGAPSFEQSELPDKNLALDLRMSRLEPLPGYYFQNSTQLPKIYVDVYNTGGIETPKYAKKSGFHENPNPVDVQKAAWQMFYNPYFEWPKYNPESYVTGNPIRKVRKLLESGEWTRQQAADYLWNLVAATYIAYRDEGIYMFFETLYDTWKRAGIDDFYVGLTTSSRSESIDSLINQMSARRFAYFHKEKRCYFDFEPWNTPGSIPLSMQGRTGILPVGNRENMRRLSSFNSVLKLQFGENGKERNRQLTRMDARLDESMMRVDVVRTDSCYGAQRGRVPIVAVNDMKKAYGKLLAAAGDAVKFKEDTFAGWNDAEERMNILKNIGTYFSDNYGKWVMAHSCGVKDFGLESDTAAVVTEVTFTVNDVVKFDADSMIVEVGALFEPGTIPSLPPGRVDDLMIPFPYERIWNVTMAVPEGYEPVGISDVVENVFENEYGCVSVTMDTDSVAVNINVRLSIDVREVKACDADKFRKLLEAHAGLCKRAVAFRRNESASHDI